MKRFIALFATLFISISTFAQSDYFQNRRQEFASFIEKRQSEFARFRDSVNLEYTKFMRSAWQKYYGEEPIPDTSPTAGIRFCMGLSIQIYIFSASLI